MEHVRAIRELRSERQAASRTARTAALADAIASLKSRFVGQSAETTPDCCPA